MYGLQRGALAHTEQQIIKGAKICLAISQIFDIKLLYLEEEGYVQGLLNLRMSLDYSVEKGSV